VNTSLRKVDCTQYESIIRHPLFTRLNEVSQLSFVDKVYRGAKHSRFDHSVFVFHFADEITNHLVKKDCISKRDKKNTRFYISIF
jgi:HD superfamily phosphohydrolase